MATSVGIREFKKRTHRLIERAARGERIVITRYGKPRAQLQPVEGPEEPALTPYNQGVLEEEQAYQRLLPKLGRKYKGRYVAVRGGKVADSDQDHNALFKRLWVGENTVPFFVGPVGFEEPVIDMPGFEVLR